jgi:hypothetical protein
MTTSARVLHHRAAQAEHAAEWQAAKEALLLVTEHDGPTVGWQWGRVASITRQCSIQVPEPAVRF